MRTPIVLSLFALATPGLPVHTASFSGAVLHDPSERPLANVEVSFIDIKLSTRSDSNGRFELKGLPVGAHTLLVRIMGFNAFNAKIAFADAQHVSADILLTELSRVAAAVVWYR